MNYWDGLSWVPLKKGTQGQSLTFCDGKPAWVVGGICPGTIQSFSCSSASHTGSLISGVPVSGVSTQLGYNGGNQGPYSQISIPSTGVLGLTATVASGVFALGSGSITVTITGKPTTSGVANFELTLGGVACTISRTVIAGAISTLNCTTPTNAGSLTRGVVASGVTSNISYTGGNQGSYGEQIITSTGVDGLTAKLTAGNFANGNGSLVFTISGTPKTAGTANFQVTVGGVSCSFTRTVNQPAAAITSVLCTQIQHRGYLTASKLSSAESDVPYTGGNGGTYPAFSVVSTGITGLTAKIGAGLLAEGDGKLTYQITGTPSGVGTASFALSIGGKTCTLSRAVLATGTLTSIDCANATNNGTLNATSAASGVTSVISYTGGNGGTHNGQVVTSTGVTGLTATLQAGVFASGIGSLTYSITGTSTSSGIASFAINIGGKTCVLTRKVDGINFTSIGTPVGSFQSNVSDNDGNSYKTVQIGTQVWMAENLKTSKYSDGTTIPNITDNTQLSNLTTGAWAYYNNDAANNAKYGKLYNWYAVSPTTNGNKNVCPTGWHVPTDAEWTVLTDYLGGENVAGGKLKEVDTTNWISPNTESTNASLFTGLPGGSRYFYGYYYNDVGSYGYWWSSTESSIGSAWYRYLHYYSEPAYRNYNSKQYGFSVRCLRD